MGEKLDQGKIEKLSGKQSSNLKNKINKNPLPLPVCHPSLCETGGCFELTQFLVVDQQIGQLYELMRTIKKQSEENGGDPLS